MESDSGMYYIWEDSGNGFYRYESQFGLRFISEISWDSFIELT